MTTFVIDSALRPSDHLDKLIQLANAFGAEPGDVNGSILPLVRELYREDQGDPLPRHADGTDSYRQSLRHLLFAQAVPLFGEGGKVPEQDYLYLQAKALCSDLLGTDQAGPGNVLSQLRHTLMKRLDKQSPVGERRQFAFKASAIAYRDIPLIATLPPTSLDAHRGMIDVAFMASNGRLVPMTSIPAMEVTHYKESAPSIEVLGRLHRFSKYGVGQVTFGDWFTADGSGRELLAAMLDGLVIRAGEPTENGMGGVSPNFALTDKGAEYVIAHPRLAGLFDHFNNIERSTAFVIGATKTVPFDTHTGAVLGQLREKASHSPAYIRDASTYAPGMTYRLEDMGCFIPDGLQRWREMEQQREENSANLAPFEELSEDAFEDRFGYAKKDDGGTMYEANEIAGMDANHVWSVVEGGDDDTLYLLPGIHHVNHVGYVISERPWPHDQIQAVYMEALDDELEMEPGCRP